jgi:hypothetical protein
VRPYCRRVTRTSHCRGGECSRNMASSRDRNAQQLLEKNVTPHSRAALSGLYSNNSLSEQKLSFSRFVVLYNPRVAESLPRFLLPTSQIAGVKKETAMGEAEATSVRSLGATKRSDKVGEVRVWRCLSINDIIDGCSGHSDLRRGKALKDVL